MEEEIDGGTNKKWKRRFDEERAAIESDVATIETGGLYTKWNKLERLLPELKNIRQLFYRTSLNRRQSLIQHVFNIVLSITKIGSEHFLYNRRSSLTL